MTESSDNSSGVKDSWFRALLDKLPVHKLTAEQTLNAISEALLVLLLLTLGWKLSAEWVMGGVLVVLFFGLICMFSTKPRRKKPTRR